MTHKVLIEKIETIWKDISPHWQAREANKYYSNTIRVLEQLVSTNELATLQMKETSDDLKDLAQRLYYEM